MIRVKICGITNRDDALAAVAMGADALGFVFALSLRQMTPGEVVDIRRCLPSRVAVIGVFVAEPVDEIARIAQICALDFCQVHGEITPEHRQMLGQRLIPAVTVDGVDPLDLARSYRTSVVLLDAPHPDRTNPTTATFDWKLARRTATELRVVLAGGLNTENVVQAIEIVRPYAVDVSSGVEIRPGKKDHEKLSHFIQRIRAWNSRTNAGISVSSADDLFLKH